LDNSIIHIKQVHTYKLEIKLLIMDTEKEAIALPKRSQKFQTKLFPKPNLLSQKIARRKAIKAELSDRFENRISRYN